MLPFLKQPAYKPAETGPEADAKYKRLRLQVFLGAFIGYAGFYLVRKNLSMAIPAMAPLGFEKTELGFVLGLNAAAYALSRKDLRGRGFFTAFFAVTMCSHMAESTSPSLVIRSSMAPISGRVRHS